MVSGDEALGFTLSREAAEQASSLATWLFVAAVPLSIAAAAQWVRFVQKGQAGLPVGKIRFSAELLTFFAVGSTLVGIILLAMVRRSQAFS